MTEEEKQEKIEREKIDTPAGTSSKPKKTANQVGEGPTPAG